jgi:hypothetical protein
MMARNLLNRGIQGTRDRGAYTDLAEIDDARDLAYARSRYAARKSHSAIVAWTLRADWTCVGPFEHRQGDARGSRVSRRGNTEADTVSGECGGSK